MSEKRFDIVGKEFVGYTEGYAYIIRDNSIVCEPHRWRQWSVWEDKEDVEDLCDLLNELNDENKTLKAQLYCESSVCTICKHQQLTPYKGMRGYYTAKCEKGHKDCSKEDLKHCEDFKLEGLSE